MTVDCTNIEGVLGPLRKFYGCDNQMISLRSLRLFEPPERSKAWAAIKWTDTSDPPVSEWLGFAEIGSSHEEVLHRLRVAAFIGFMDFVPVLADGHPWCLLNHQAAGHACSQVRFVARRILLSADIESEWLRIATYWYNQQLGLELPALSTLAEYRAQLQRIGLDCNSSRTYQYLKEGFYPVDLN